MGTLIIPTNYGRATTVTVSAATATEATSEALATNALLEQTLTVLKKMERHLSVGTDDELKDQDV